MVVITMVTYNDVLPYYYSTRVTAISYFIMLQITIGAS